MVGQFEFLDRGTRAPLRRTSGACRSPGPPRSAVSRAWGENKREAAMIVITGATGNTGSVAADALLARGEKIRVVGRDASKLERFASRGAETFVGNAESEADMVRAFTGATAVYLVIPQALHLEDFRAYQERISSAFAAAVAKCFVKFAVVLSSIGGQ